MHPHSQDIPEQQLDMKTPLHLNSKLLAQIVLSSSTCQVVLHPNVDVSHSVLFVLVFPDVTATRVRMSIRHLLLVRGFHRHIPRSTRADFLSFSRSVSAILSLYAFILAFPVKVLSMFVLILSWHSSLCGFVAFPCDASAANPGRRQDVESSGFKLWRSFKHNPW